MGKGILDGILGSGLTALAGIGQQIAQNAYNRKEAEKNRDFQSAEAEENRLFQSNEAALQRDWSAAEAERARDWQEEMYEKYNSLSGKIAQAEAAGVNPMFAVTGGAVTPAPTSASSPSGASAGSVGTPSGSQAASSFVDIVGQVLGFQKMKAEVDLMASQAEKNRTDAHVSLSKLAAEIRSLETSADLDVQKALESVQNVENLKAQLNLTNEQASAVASQINYLDSQANYINAIKDPEVRRKRAEAEVAEWMDKNKELFKSLDFGLEAAQIIADIGIGIFNAKTKSNMPFVVPKDGQVYFPSDIVH